MALGSIVAGVDEEAVLVVKTITTANIRAEENGWVHRAIALKAIDISNIHESECDDYFLAQVCYRGVYVHNNGRASWIRLCSWSR